MRQPAPRTLEKPFWTFVETSSPSRGHLHRRCAFPRRPHRPVTLLPYGSRFFGGPRVLHRQRSTGCALSWSTFTGGLSPDHMYRRTLVGESLQEHFYWRTLSPEHLDLSAFHWSTFTGASPRSTELLYRWDFTNTGTPARRVTAGTLPRCTIIGTLPALYRGELPRGLNRHSAKTPCWLLSTANHHHGLL